MKAPVLAVTAAVGASMLWWVSVSSGQPSDEERIRGARRASNEAIRAHDADAVASFFTDDYNLVSPNLQITGRAETATIREADRSAPDVVYVRTPREIGFYTPWGMAYEIGTWEGSWTESGQVEIGGTYLAKWQNVSGRWLIRAEVFVPTHCKGSSYCDAGRERGSPFLPR
jgi:ketosteroid isomerase-like protein